MMNRQIVSGVLLALVIAAFVGLSVPNVDACDTPVYRYALYRWPAAPYEVYYFHTEKPTDEVQAFHQEIDALGEDKKTPANIALIPVDASDLSELEKSVPPDIKTAFEQLDSPELPIYLVSTPYGQTIYSGELTSETLASLVDSPARQAMAKRLEAGDAGVLIFLTSSDEAANKVAEDKTRKVVSDVQDGKVQLYSAPTGGAPGEEMGPGMKIGFVKVDRSDAKESWFVRQLLTIEDDLHELDQPMVFAAFGRGRLLPPCVGRGIQRDTLIDEYVHFMTGACSCTVKDQNPGMDLLVRYDWDRAAGNLKEKFGQEEGNENIFGADEIFPQLSIPQGDVDETVTTKDVDTDDVDDVVATAVTDNVDEDQLPATNNDKQISPASAQDEVDTTKPAADDEAVIASKPAIDEVASTPVPLEDGEVSTSFGSVYLVGAGVAVALAFLFAATFIIMRPR